MGLELSANSSFLRFNRARQTDTTALIKIKAAAGSAMPVMGAISARLSNPTQINRIISAATIVSISPGISRFLPEDTFTRSSMLDAGAAHTDVFCAGWDFWRCGPASLI
jgi:hypothetical protein